MAVKKTEIKKNTTKKETTEEQKSLSVARKDQVFRDMCTWLELEIFGYDIEHQRLQTSAVLKLQGLRKGQTVANNSQETHGDYSWEVIWITFKANKVQILNAIKGKNFKSESDKMAYICAIVRNKINDVYMRLKSIEKSEEKIERVETIESQAVSSAEYKSKTNRKNDEKFKEMW